MQRTFDVRATQDLPSEACFAGRSLPSGASEGPANDDPLAAISRRGLHSDLPEELFARSIGSSSP